MQRRAGPILGLSFFILIAGAVGIVIFTVPGGFSSLFGSIGLQKHIPFSIAVVPMQPGRTVILEAGAGNVTLRSDSARTSLAVSGTKVVQDDEDFNKISLQPKNEADGSLTLQVVKSCQNCYMDIDLIAPPNTLAILHSGSGDIRADGLSSQRGLNSFSTGSGNIKLSNYTAGSLNVQTGSGDITLDTVTINGVIMAQAGSGNINFNGTMVLTDPSSLFETGSGDLFLKLNASDYSKISLEAMTKSGDIRNRANLPNVDSSKHALVVVNGPNILVLHTGSGNITLE